MKSLLFFTFMVIAGFEAFAQERDAITPTIAMTNYSNYGITIPFEGSIQIISVTNKGTSYFEQAVEILRFNENTQSFEANAQRLISEDIVLPEIEEILSDTGKSLEESLKELEDAQALEPSIYSSLSNDFNFSFYRSSLFILPATTIDQLRSELEGYVKQHPNYQLVEGVKELKNNRHEGFKCRIQQGKTRLDHFFVLGESYTYLFVSSPYGDDGKIEELMGQLKISK